MLGEYERALLAHLDDVALLERLFRERAGSSASRPGGVAAALGLLEELAGTPEGEEILTGARRGDHASWKRLSSLLDAPPLGDRPRLLHHLALFESAVADAAELSSPGSARALRAALRAIELWATLASHPSYLRDLAHAVAGDELSAGDLDAAVESAWLGRVESIASTAREGISGRKAAAGRALHLLETLETASLNAAVNDEIATKLRAHARRRRSQAIDDALASLAEDLHRARAETSLAPQLDILHDATELYAFTRGSRAVALFITDAATPLSWSLYKAKRWTDLRTLAERIRYAVDALAKWVETSPDGFAYAAQVAQLLVFRAEMGKALAAQITDAERAIGLCSTHRNARLILADLLAARGLATMDQTGFLNRDAHLDRAEADVSRAESLWSDLPRVERARRRLDRMRGKRAAP